MKKVLVVFFCFHMLGCIMAQEEHLSFKGVPINGTLEQYTDSMVNKGFTFEGKTDDGMVILTGDFAGFIGCIVGVSTLSNCDLVNRIAVLFPEKETWAALINDYEHLKEMLTKKYGKPEKNEERILRTVYSDNSKIYAVNDDEIKWYTIFSSELGKIELTLVGGSVGYKACVRLTGVSLNLCQALPYSQREHAPFENTKL